MAIASVEGWVRGGPLKSYKPSSANPWDRYKVAHLLNRAGFGGTPEEVEHLVKIGYENAMDEIVNYEKFQDDFPEVDFSEVDRRKKELLEKRAAQALGFGQKPKDDPEFRKLFQKLQQANRQAMEEAVSLWIRRMIQTRRPLQEKMTLFWHGHLTSSARDVENARHMYQQNEFFRKNALGNFREILIGISKDPAMLRYLDNNTSRKEHPNENYARELMELFSMGIGNYTDVDVKEAARAFTGWTFERFGDEFIFRPQWHDYGEKTFLGKVGNWDGTDIIDIILEQPVTARFISRKLFEFFVYPNPEPELVEAMAELLRENHYEFKPLVRAILQSEVFYSDKAYRTQIKSPVQLVVGTVRLLGLQGIPERLLWLAMSLMGQELFAPPNVKGWDGGEAWINTSTLFLRYNFAYFVITGKLPGAQGAPRGGDQEKRLVRAFSRFSSSFTPQKLLRKSRTPEEVVDTLIDRFIQTRINEPERNKLVEFASKLLITPLSEPSDETLKQIVHLILCLPEYQVC